MAFTSDAQRRYFFANQGVCASSSSGGVSSSSSAGSGVGSGSSAGGGGGGPVVPSLEYFVLMIDAHERELATSNLTDAQKNHEREYLDFHIARIKKYGVD